MTSLNWNRNRVHERNQHDPLPSGGRWIAPRKPLTDKQRAFILKLRAELGDLNIALPHTCSEGRDVIEELLARKRARR